MSLPSLPPSSSSAGRAKAFLATTLAVSLVSLLCGCATTNNLRNPRDPFEGVNRAVFDLNDGIDKVIIEFEPMWVLRALQLHFLATPLGYQRTYGSQQVVATLLGFDQRTLEVVRERRKHFAPVLGRGLPDFGLQRRAS